jgi:tetratricopeptide (TPR) repeat protein
VTSLDEFGQSAILNFLANRGLIIRGQSPGSLCLEPSASVLVKEELRSLRLFPIYMENFLRLMESNWPRDPEGCDIFQKDSSCIFQAFSTLRVLTELCVEDQISQAGLSIIVSMATRLTRLLTNMGLHVKARHMAQKVLEWGPAIFSSDAAANSAVRRQLAVGERYSGRLQVAARMELEVLKLQTDVLGDSHPETMRSLNNYALTLRSQGKLADAKRAHCIALSTQERILGMNHPDTLISVSNLGQCLQDLGQHVSAESMLRRALSSRQILFTPTHPAILTSMSDLGVSYILQHRYEEAENIHRMCLYNRGMMFGVDHPQTIRSKSNLAITLTHQGRQKSAEILLREVAAKLDALLGSDQPESIKAHQNLARFLRDQNRYQEAEELLRVCSARAEQALGRTHSRTIDIWRELSIIFHHMEKYVEALKFAIRVRGVRVELFGFENSATCDSIRHVEQLQSLL